MPLRSLLLICGFLTTCTQTQAADTPRPNVLLLLADDLGYSDLGCYGGEIATPNLDKLAAGGLRFTQFYNTARCWPTRAAILTGQYAQSVRRDAFEGAKGGGSQAKRPAWAHLLPVFLREHGYRNYHSGKWHIDGQPLQNGFDHSYRIDDQDRHFSPKQHWLDDMPQPDVNRNEGYYGTVAIADHAIKTLKQHATDHAGKPFFHYVAWTTPHFPLMALPEDIARYKGKYAAGWDALRVERHKRMRELGLVNCDLSPRTADVPAWDSLTDAQRIEWQHRMEVHAAMVDRIDRETGRLLDQLRAMNTLDNTLILFVSDNGASAEKILRGDGHDDTAEPGSAGWYRCLEPGWANLANTPFRFSKIYVHEGGISTPCIVHWPAKIAAKGELRHGMGHVMDIPPTIMVALGLPWPKEWQGQSLPAPEGKSLTPLFTTNAPSPHQDLWWSHSGNRAIRSGDWKLVSAGKDSAGNHNPWELYDLSKDRSESHDLAKEMPDRVNELAALWQSREAANRALANRE
jgi:arylsulfatase A-like enzyme